MIRAILQLFGWRLIRVRGRSMMPTLQDGDLVLARAAGRGRAHRAGDVVSLRHAGVLMIKRLVQRQRDGRFSVSGDGAASMPSIDLGYVDAVDILATAIIRISPKGLHFLGTQRPIPAGCDRATSVTAKPGTDREL